jgi:arabinogalactan oligomer/maltooligosaccharide transport system permease protein
VSELLAAPTRNRAGRGAPTGTPRPAPGSGTGGLIGKVLLLGLVAAIAVWGAFPLIEARAWPGLAILVAVTLLIFYVYLSPRAVPAKYLLPGTLFLIAFQVFLVLYTVGTAFTNFGDGHRGSKRDAVQAIQTASITPVAGGTEYGLSVATTGDPARGPLVFLLVDPAGTVFAGDAEGLRPLSADEVGVTLGRVSKADGYTLLNLGQASARSREITEFTVPTANGAIRSTGVSRASERQAGRRYDAACDCIVETATGHRWTADEASGTFVDDTGARLPQGWRVNVGFANFTRVVTDPEVARPFFGTLLWNIAFALGSVLGTFALGLLCALALHRAPGRRGGLAGRAWYRVLLVLPYAMPSFAMLLVWRDMFNADFGLVNRLFDVHVDWLGSAWTARLAVILVQLWLGYPYMFLVATGALQAIPNEMNEAAEMDGASAWQRFRAVTLPLLLVALSPLLIASFAFNFNNFNAIFLTTAGGPFPADNPNVGATDLLITYTYRLAFGGSGAQYGFAAAVSFYIFLIVAVISVVSFWRTRRQEEVYS